MLFDIICRLNSDVTISSESISSLSDVVDISCVKSFFLSCSLIFFFLCFSVDSISSESGYTWSITPLRWWRATCKKARNPKKIMNPLTVIERKALVRNQFLIRYLIPCSWVRRVKVAFVKDSEV